MLFPDCGGTRLQLRVRPDGDRLPVVGAVLRDPDGSARAAQVAALTAGRGAALLVEHGHGAFTRPGLRGHRADGSGWAPLFGSTRVAT
ncbi:MAG: hypothetical protein FWD74_04465, partial [Actinomycetia bacterium]|nr:hypothetical protein [Actinomycetes bacterium]